MRGLEGSLSLNLSCFAWGSWDPQMGRALPVVTQLGGEQQGLRSLEWQFNLPMGPFLLSEVHFLYGLKNGGQFYNLSVSCSLFFWHLYLSFLSLGCACGVASLPALGRPLASTCLPLALLLLLITVLVEVAPIWLTPRAVINSMCVSAVAWLFREPEFFK